MKVIALRGDENRGKSETLNIVYQMMLLFGYQQVPGHFNDLGNLAQKDFIDILEKKGVKVGIVTLGDYDDDKKGPWSVSTYLDYLENHGCDKAICAFRHQKMPLTLAKINSYPNKEIIPKRIATSLAERRILNGEDAERIYRLI